MIIILLSIHLFVFIQNPLQRITAQQICEYPEVVYRLDKIKEEDIEEEGINEEFDSNLVWNKEQVN